MDESEYIRAQEQLRNKHKEELVALENEFLRTNTVVTITPNRLCGRYDDGDGGPYKLEIAFGTLGRNASQLFPQEQRDQIELCLAITKALNAELSRLGYRVEWRTPKSEKKE